jgi:hypothetical protein
VLKCLECTILQDKWSIYIVLSETHVHTSRSHSRLDTTLSWGHFILTLFHDEMASPAVTFLARPLATIAEATTRGTDTEVQRGQPASQAVALSGSRLGRLLGQSR